MTENDPPPAKSEWTFLTNHLHTLICLAWQPQVTMREVAREVGITERAVQKIVCDLVDEGYIKKERQGRRNHYVIVTDRPLRHRLESQNSIGTLLAALKKPHWNK